MKREQALEVAGLRGPHFQRLVHNKAVLVGLELLAQSLYEFAGERTWRYASRPHARASAKIQFGPAVLARAFDGIGSDSCHSVVLQHCHL